MQLQNYLLEKLLCPYLLEVQHSVWHNEFIALFKTLYFDNM